MQRKPVQTKAASIRVLAKRGWKATDIAAVVGCSVGYAKRVANECAPPKAKAKPKKKPARRVRVVADPCSEDGIDERTARSMGIW